LIQKNINPIERVERSLLIMGSVLNEISPLEMVRDNQVNRLKETEERLLTNGEEDSQALLFV
jgi:hypothetical protein